MTAATRRPIRCRALCKTCGRHNLFPIDIRDDDARCPDCGGSVFYFRHLRRVINFREESA